MRDALDAAWGDFPTWDVGYDWLRYTGSARPDAGWVGAVEQHSLVTFIQESYSTRSSEGYDVGVADCAFAEARAREVHPGVRSLAVCASDGNYADGWDASGYGRGWSDTATLPFFFYGAHGVIDSAVAGAQAGRGAGLLVLGTDGQPGRWVPETWGPTNLIGQVVGASPVGDTDLNHVHADYTGSSAPAPSAPIPQQEESMYREDRPDGTSDYFIIGSTRTVSVPASVGVGTKLNGGVVVPVKPAERQAMDLGLAAAAPSSGGTGAPDPAKVQAVTDATAALAAAVQALLAG